MDINMIKTDKCCFISDCYVIEGYNYHNTKINNLLFDGSNPLPSYAKNWYKIDKYPIRIQQIINLPALNKRYKIKDRDMISIKLPEIILYSDMQNYDEDIINLYKFVEDKQEPILEDIEVNFNILFEIQNFEFPPVINYTAIKPFNFSTKEFNITNTNIKHQLFDEIIFPEIMLHTRPCFISSFDLYCLVRQYIKENIDNRVARISSDYDFSFEVQKIVPLYEPETISYQKIFSKSKKEREKIYFKNIKIKEFLIFEMTHDQYKYKNNTIIKPIFADNEKDLKNKIDEFLETLIILINKPLKPCDCCKGSGYIESIRELD